MQITVKVVDIEAAYHGYWQQHWEQDLPLYRRTNKGMWACSDIREVHEFFREIDLHRFQHLADLGSGDGRVVAVASLFTMATGIESDPDMVAVARLIHRRLGLRGARCLQADFLAADLSGYDVLYSYPDKPLDMLEEKLSSSNWQGWLIVAGPHFPLTSLAKAGEKRVGQTTFSIYRTGGQGAATPRLLSPGSKVQGG